METQRSHTDLFAELEALVSTAERKAEQLRPVVPIEEWLQNRFYVGEDGLELYDYWKEELVNFHHSGKNEWILFGSLGSGKTTAAVFAFIRKIYELSCYLPIPYLYGLMRSTTIYFIYFSVSLIQARRTGFARFQDIIDSIPYFNDYFSRDKGFRSLYKYPGISVIYGSSVAHQIGMDLLTTLLDEGDFYDEQKGVTAFQEFSRAREIYLSTINRRQQRFSINGRDSGLSILVSSPAYGTSFVESRIESSRRRDSAYISEPIGYKINRSRHATTFFHVFTGTEDIDPRVIDSVDDLMEVIETAGIDSPPDQDLSKFSLSALVRFARENGLEIEDVPENLRQSFEDDPLRAVRDIIGKAIRAVSIYMDNKMLAPCITKRLKHPFTKQVISLSTKDTKRIEDYFKAEWLMLDPDLPRYIHIDQSVTNDRTGMACSLMAEEDMPEAGYPHVITEWMLAVTPPAIGEIPILRCAEFIVWLYELGYNIQKVTMDSFQSRASLQYFNEQGLDADLRSVDRYDDAYVSVRNLVNNGKHHLYDYPLYAREIVDLIWDRSRRKVDHPPAGSKDVTDAVAGSVQNVLEESGFVLHVSAIVEEAPDGLPIKAYEDDSPFVDGRLVDDDTLWREIG